MRTGFGSPAATTATGTPASIEVRERFSPPRVGRLWDDLFRSLGVALEDSALYDEAAHLPNAGTMRRPR